MCKMYQCDKCNAIVHHTAMANHTATCPCYCQYCDVVTDRETIKSRHKEKCHKLPLKCHNCGLDEIPQDKMNEHRKKCSSEMIQCECGTMIARSEVDKHIKEKMIIHFLLRSLEKFKNVYHKLCHVQSSAVYSVVSYRVYLIIILCLISVSAVVIQSYCTVNNHNLDLSDVQDVITAKLHENFNSDIHQQFSKLYEKISHMQDHNVNNLHDKVNAVLKKASTNCDESKQKDLGQCIEELQTVTTKLTQALTKAGILVEELENKPKIADSERKQQSKELMDCESCVSDLDQKVKKYESERKKQSKELMDCESRVSDLDQKVKKYESERKKQSKELLDCESGVSDLDQKVKKYESEKKKQSKELMDCESRVSDLDQKVKKNESEKKKQSKKLMDCESRVSDLKEKIRVADQTVAVFLCMILVLIIVVIICCIICAS